MLLKEAWLRYSIDPFDHILSGSAAHLVSIHHIPIFNDVQESIDLPYIFSMEAPSKEHLQVSITDLTMALKSVHLWI